MAEQRVPAVICVYFNSKNGCRFGSKCRFVHRVLPPFVRPQLDKDSISLIWENNAILPSLEDEEVMRDLLVKSEEEGKLGKLNDLDQERKEEILPMSLSLGFSLLGVASLRRQFIREIFHGDSQAFYASGNLGSPKGAQEYSRNFELTLESYLKSKAIKYLTEKEQLELGNYVNTPDFLIQTPLLINGQIVNWIDCKTFYGSSSLSTNLLLPIGKIKSQAERYTKEFGNGCFLFLSGFSRDLERQAGFRVQDFKVEEGVDVVEDVALASQPLKKNKNKHGGGGGEGEREGEGKDMDKISILLLDSTPLDISQFLLSI